MFRHHNPFAEHGVAQVRQGRMRGESAQWAHALAHEADAEGHPPTMLLLSFVRPERITVESRDYERARVCIGQFSPPFFPNFTYPGSSPPPREANIPRTPARRERTPKNDCFRSLVLSLAMTCHPTRCAFRVDFGIVVDPSRDISVLRDL